MALVLINAVGLTPRWLEYAPRLKRLAEAGWMRPMSEVLPGVTCTAQTTMLTGTLPQEHGIVGNGWLFRDTGEVRFWQQSNRLVQEEPLYQTARRRAEERGSTFRCAKLFWWFNQGADVAWSVTPKPHYGADGSKAFGVHGNPEGITERLERKLGTFPFFTFWGPNAGLPCTDWIARCAAEFVQSERPDLTLVYLPHLDYQPQRVGPSQCDMPKLVRELDDACAPLLDAASANGTEVWVVSEYGHVDVTRPIYLNRALRETGLVSVRDGPFGEMLDTFNSRAFAVVDHQLAHVYVARSEDVPRVRDTVASLEGVAKVYVGDEREEIGLRHSRSGEVIAISDLDAWFAYPYWNDDRRAPDFARTVDIHRKPGYDPCELFLDPQLLWPKGRAIWRVLQKKLGFRALVDVIPLDATLVRGGHGANVADPLDLPLLIGQGATPDAERVPMRLVREFVLRALDLEGP